MTSGIISFSSLIIWNRIKELHQKHMEAGIPRWDTLMDRPPHGGGWFYGAMGSAND